VAEEWEAVEANRVAEEVEDIVEEAAVGEEVEVAVAVRNQPVSRNSTVPHWFVYQMK